MMGISIGGSLSSSSLEPGSVSVSLFSSYPGSYSAFDRVFDKTRKDSEFEPRSNPNPNPNNYQIKEIRIINNFMIMKINYLDSTNYEGNKILVFDKYIKITDILRKNKGLIDPHFSDNEKFISPIARFCPDERGWKNAEIFCKSYEE